MHRIITCFILLHFVHSGRISSEDYALNKLVYSFISKYGNERNYEQLGKLIDLDKPKFNKVIN